MKYIGISRQSKSKAERIQTAVGIVLMVSIVAICIVGAGSLFSNSAPDVDSSTASSETDTLASLNVEDQTPLLENRSDEMSLFETPPETTGEDAGDDEDLIEDPVDEEDNNPTWTEVEESARYFATGTLNIRSGPGVDFDQVDELEFGDVIYVVASTSNGWKKISDGQYVIADYLSAQIPEQAFVGTYYTITNANVRSGPGTEYDITRQLTPGSPISVVAITGNGWYRTAVDTYVLAELCTSTPPATPAPTRAPTPTPIPIPSGVAEQAAAVGLSPEHFEFFASVVSAESNRSSYEGKVWIAQVIWNRANSSRWPNTAFGVVTQAGQFSVVRYDSESNSYVCRSSATPESRRAVVDAYQNPPIPSNIFYFNNRDNFSHEYYAEQGGNHFYYG